MCINPNIIFQLLEKSKTQQALIKMKTLLDSSGQIPNETKNKYIDECILLSSRLTDWEYLVQRGLTNPQDRSPKNMINLALLLICREVDEKYFQKISAKGNKVIQEDYLEINRRQVLITITLDKDYNHFDKEEKLRFLEVLESLPYIQKGDILIKAIYEGSVNIVVEFPSQKLKSLIFSYLNDDLAKLNIIDIRPYSKHNTQLKRVKGTALLEQAYKKLYPKLIFIAFGKVRNRETAEDIVHDIFLSLMSQKKTLNEITNISGYLIRSVINKSYDIHKRVQKLSTIFNKVEADIGNHLAQDTFEDLLDFEAKKLLDHIQHILNEDEFLVLEMTKAGYKGKEIGKALDKNEGNIRAIRHKAREKLRADTRIKNYLVGIK